MALFFRGKFNIGEGKTFDTSAFWLILLNTKTYELVCSVKSSGLVATN